MTPISPESKRKCQNLGCAAPAEVSFRLQNGAGEALGISSAIAVDRVSGAA